MFLEEIGISPPFPVRVFPEIKVGGKFSALETSESFNSKATLRISYSYFT